MQITNIQKSDPTVVNRYLADQLTDAERSAFEARLALDPDVLRELEATARLKAGLQKLRDTGQLDALVAEQRSRTPLFFSAAAAVAVLVLGISLLRWNADGGAPMLAASISKLVDQSGSPLPIASTYAVYRKRDAYDAEIELPASRQAIKLRVLPELRAPQASYRAALSLSVMTALLTPPVESSSCKRLETGLSRCSSTHRNLAPGKYQLVIESETRVDGSPGAEMFLIKVNPNKSNP